MNPACEITHPQISIGNCPWCAEVLGNHESSSGSNATWNLGVMLSALDSNDEHVCSVTLANVDFAGLPLADSLAIFSKALAGCSDETRDLAGQSLCLRGAEISREVAQQLETEVAGAPDELALRILLLGYYFLNRRESDLATQSRQQHILWMIRNDPELSITGGPYAYLIQPGDEEAYAIAKKIWLKHLSSQPSNTRILRNAVRFFLLRDRKISEDLLDRASALEPNSYEWHDQLAMLYSLDSRRESSTSLIRRERAFREHQIAAQLELASDGGGTGDDQAFRRILRLIALAKSAFDSKQFDEADKYATELLERIVPFDASQHTFPIGNAIHHGNLVLGRLALQSGDVNLAKEYLLAAGRTPGSPQLDSFGPNMMLAKELLERNEKAIVLEYFALCERFWKRHSETLVEWAHEVQAGRIPDFGPHLAY